MARKVKDASNPDLTNQFLRASNKELRATISSLNSQIKGLRKDIEYQVKVKRLGRHALCIYYDQKIDEKDKTITLLARENEQLKAKNKSLTIRLKDD